MIQQFVEQLRTKVKPTEIFEQFQARFDFRSYVNSSEFLKDKERLDSFSKEQSLVDITGDQNSIALYDDDEITVILSRRANKLPYAYTQTGPKFLVSLSEPTARQLHLFECTGAYGCDPVSAKRLRLRANGSVYINRLVPWSPPSMDTVYSIDSPADGSLWINAFSKTANHYFHAYSTETGEYLFSAFATIEACSLYYMAEIAFHAVRHAAAIGGESGLEALKGATKGISAIETMPATGLWRLAEAWAPVDPEQAADLLSETTTRGGAIGDKAMRTLEMLRK